MFNKWTVTSALVILVIFFWWPIRLFAQWKHIKTRAVRPAATAKRYCLDILATHGFFHYGGQRGTAFVLVLGKGHIAK